MTKWRRENAQIGTINDEKGYIITNCNEMQRIIREYFEYFTFKYTGKSRQNGQISR
jgi:hypothetical protein